MSKLVLVTLPIGNKEDITLNALSALKEGVHFLAEDTRRFLNTLDQYAIPHKGKDIRTFNDHSTDAIDRIIDQILAEKETYYLVSDAGSPLISDPAFPLLKKCLERDVAIESFSGVSAVINALEKSGLPATPFSFHGFLPRKKSEISQCFESCLSTAGTHVFFESPKRIMQTLELLVSLDDDFEVCVARELTKTHETIHRFASKNFPEVRDTIVEKGEFVLLIRSVKRNTQVLGKNLTKLANTVLEKPSSKNLSKLLAEITGDSAKEIYQKLSQS